MANKYIEDCGPNVKDHFNDWNYIKSSGYYNRHHVIKGEGELNSCSALDKYPLYSDYSVQLCAECVGTIRTGGSDDEWYEPSCFYGNGLFCRTS